MPLPEGFAPRQGTIRVLDRPAAHHDAAGPDDELRRADVPIDLDEELADYSSFVNPLMPMPENVIGIHSGDLNSTARR